MFALSVIASGDLSVFCVLPAPFSLEKQAYLWALARRLRLLQGEREALLEEVVVGMNNVSLFFKPHRLDLEFWQKCVQEVWQAVLAEEEVDDGRVLEIPVKYGGAWGEDLFEVASFHKITPEEVVRLHSEALYTVFMIGFQPGFPYLGGLPEILHTPRRKTPRVRVPQGSVGIGGSQTGIYPFASPGGWQLIGHSDVVLFDAQNEKAPTFLRAGDKVRFVVDGVEI